MDALGNKIIADLAIPISWAATFGATLFLSEFGWPKDDNDDAWNNTAEVVYDIIDENGWWTTHWASGSFWGPSYNLGLYTNSAGSVIDTAGPQAIIVEAHQSSMHGINLAGGEFGTDTIVAGGLFSSVNPGTHGTDYKYPTLADQTYVDGRLPNIPVRIPFRWERVQPTLLGALDATEMTRIDNLIADAASLGLSVVLECHNYVRRWEGARTVSTQPLVMVRSGGSLNALHLADLWERLALRYRLDTTVIAYEIMNEPHDLVAEIGSFSPNITYYNWNDGTIQGWLVDGGGSVANVANRLRFTKTAATTGVINGSGTFASSSGDVLDVIINPVESGWFARLMWQGPGFFWHTGIRIALTAGFDNQITYEFTDGPIAAIVDNIGIRFERDGAASDLTVDIDTFRRGALAGGLTEAQVWEAIADETALAIRNPAGGNDLTHAIAVATYNWSGAETILESHPNGPFITASGDIWYVIHYYMDENGSGDYGAGETWADTYAHALSLGFTDDPEASVSQPPLFIQYEGNWPDYPEIRIIGPIVGPKIENTSIGESINIDYSVPAGRTLIITLTPGNKSVELDDGTNLMGYVTLDSDLGTFRLESDPTVTDGKNYITLSGSGISSTTQWEVLWNNRYIGLGA